MCSYLNRTGAKYYFRRPVPKDLLGYFKTDTGRPRTEWKFSLGVTDREAAKPLLHPFAAETDRLIAEARAVLVAAKPAPPAVAQPSLREREEEEARTAEAEAKRRRYEARSEFRKLWRQRMMRSTAEMTPEEAAARDIIDERGRDVEEYRREVDFLKARVAALGGPSPNTASAAPVLPLTGLFDRFAQVPGRSPKTMGQWRPYIVRLVDFLGFDDAAAVTTKDLIAWRNYLRDQATFRGNALSAKTINGSYLGAVGAVLAWAHGDGLLDANPIRGVSKVSLPKAPQLRNKEFTSDEALCILRATLVPSEGRQGDDWRKARRWVPWILAYSGARVNEITQLRKEDVASIDGIPVLRLTPEAGPIKARAARLVPLHRHLLEQGFLDFVEGRRDGPLFYNPTLRRSEAAINRQANRLGSKLAEWVRGLGIAGVKPNHAWRHLFNTQAVRYQMDHRATLAILGHSSGNVNQQYGSVPVDALVRELNKLPSYDLTAGKL